MNDRVTIRKILIALAVLFLLAAAVVAFGWLGAKVKLEHAVGFMAVGLAIYIGSELLA